MKFKTILADPPWRFSNRTTKASPEHKRLHRYETMRLEDITAMPVNDMAEDNAHLYLWVPNALIKEGIEVMQAWGFEYKTMITWLKVAKSGKPDGRGMGYYFRGVTEQLLFGVKGSLRTLKPGRTQTNVIQSVKREHSRKPDEQYNLIESCSPGEYLELFARTTRSGWTMWGNEVNKFEEVRRD